MRGEQMKCERCQGFQGDEDARYRVYSDAMDIRVCALCADKARELQIAVEVLPSIASPIIGLPVPNERGLVTPLDCAKTSHSASNHTGDRPQIILSTSG